MAGIFVFLWKLAFAVVAIIFLLGMFGYEKIKVSKTEIEVCSLLFGLGYKKKIPINALINCEYNDKGIRKRMENRRTYYLNSPGKIRIETPYKAYEIGQALDYNEANDLVVLINKRVSF